MSDHAIDIIKVNGASALAFILSSAVDVEQGLRIAVLAATLVYTLLKITDRNKADK